MKKEKMYKIGKKLGISKSDAKKAIQKNRNKIMASIIIGVAAVMVNKIWFEPLHYISGSIVDFDFFTRFF